jgi:hypothetical protein
MVGMNVLMAPVVDPEDDIFSFSIGRVKVAVEEIIGLAGFVERRACAADLMLIPGEGLDCESKGSLVFEVEESKVGNFCLGTELLLHGVAALGHFKKGFFEI